MQINVPDSLSQTVIFTTLFLLVIFLTLKKKDQLGFSHDLTNELKGLAILMVIFSHAGYFLSTNTQFLFPLSVAGGVGVNIFLFLSGFGLTVSALKKSLSVFQFYLKRLSKIFLPMWIVLVVLITLDYLILGKTQPLTLTLENFLGFFPQANIFEQLDSPLWYFTPILFYYLIFPLLFFKKYPLVSVILLFLVSVLVVRIPLPVNPDVLKLYQLHNLAFPLGMGLALLLSKKDIFSFIFKTNPLLRYFSLIPLLLLLAYFAIHSGVGETIFKEQFLSLITVMVLLLIVLIKPFQFRFLMLMGIYSYEIYLIQWPLVYRYDFLYKYLPAGIATFLYLFIFLLIAYLLNKLIKFIARKPRL